jgi:hypothetical protein
VDVLFFKNFFTMTKLLTPFLMGICLSILAFNPLLAQPFFEEDFDGGIPATWTLEEPISSGGPFSSWIHTDDGPQGPFLVDPIESTTAANGWAMFDSDSDCNDTAGQDAWLISPLLDCTDKTAVYLQFQTYYRRFNDLAFVMVGTDLGDLGSWTEIEVFPGITNNSWGDGATTGAAAANPQNILIDLSDEMAGESAVYFAFRFFSDPSTIQAGTLYGCAYSWQIDDVVLTEDNPLPPHDMQANDNWFAVAPNVLWPASQLEPFSFICDIQNVGAQEQTNVNLNITIVDDATGNTVYTADQAYGTITADSIAENVSFGEFTPPSSPAPNIYTATYTVTADSTDLNPDNNSVSFQFAVTDTVFAKEFGEPNASLYLNSLPWDPGEPRSWAFGNYYYVPNGDGWYANTATFSVEVPSGSSAETVQVTLYEWADTNGDTIAQLGERTQLGSIIYTLSGNETVDQLITAPIVNIGTGLSPALGDDKAYLLMIEYNAEGEEELRFGGSDALDYGAMEMSSIKEGHPRFTTFIAFGGDLSGEDYDRTAGFVAAARLNIGQTPLFSSTKEVLNASEILKISPNPASTYVQFDVNLPESSSLIRFQLIDVSGKSFGVQEFQNLKDVSTTFNTSNLPAGTYFVRIDTDKGYAMERFIVQQ